MRVGLTKWGLILISMLLVDSLSAEAIKIGLIPEQNIFKQMNRYEPLGEYIQQQTGIEVRFTLLSRYGNIIDNFTDLELDGAFWGSFTGALAIKKLGVQHIVRPVNKDGTSSYRGYIFVRSDSPINTVADMRGRVFAFVDKATTAGYLFPLAYLRERKVGNLDGYFKEMFFAGSHDAAIHAVLKGEADIGSAKNTIYDAMEHGSGTANNLRILATSPDVPSNGLGLRRGMPKATVLKLQGVLLAMENNADGRAVLEEFGVVKFITAGDEDYRPLFELAETAGIDLQTYDYSNQ